MAQGRATIKHRVKLAADERRELEQLVRRGAAGWKLRRAQALLKCDQGEAGPGWPDAQVARAFDAASTRLLRDVSDSTRLSYAYVGALYPCLIKQNLCAIS